MNKCEIKDKLSLPQSDISNLVYADDCLFLFDPMQTGPSINSILNTLTSRFNKFISTKLEPNYFLCIKINNNKIIEACDRAQREILSKNPDLNKASVKIDTLHVTLLAFYLRDEQEIELFYTKLEENRILFDDLKNFELTFQGISTFGDRVIYADLLKDDHFTNLIKFQKNLVKVAEQMSLPLFEKKFSPHLTLMKLSKAKNLLKKGIKKINKEFYEHLSDSHFGIESVANINMCSIREKDHLGKFYKTYWQFELNK